MTDPMGTKPTYQARGGSGASDGESRPGRVRRKRKSPDELGDGRVFTKIAEEWARTGSFSRALREKGETLIYGEGDKLIVEYPNGRKRIFPEHASLLEIRAAIDEYYEVNPPKDGRRVGKNVRS